MEPNRLRSIIEAMIFVAEEPLSVNTMLLVLEPDGVTKADIQTALDGIKARCLEDESVGVCLMEVAGGYHFRTKPAASEYIQRMNQPKASRLSQQALETLAIIAYRQPVVRSEIEDIRGVDSGGVLKTLLERNLIKIIGKRDEPGTPLIYATTSRFLELFNLSSLKDLPTLREFEDLEKEHYKGTTAQEEPKPILEEVNAAPFEQKWTQEDDTMLNELTDSIKKLRRLEKEIFPKPVETIVAVPNQDPTSGLSQQAAAGNEEVSGCRPDPGVDDAGTLTEDTGAGD